MVSSSLICPGFLRRMFSGLHLFHFYGIFWFDCVFFVFWVNAVFRFGFLISLSWLSFVFSAFWCFNDGVCMERVLSQEVAYFAVTGKYVYFFFVFVLLFGFFILHRCHFLCFFFQRVSSHGVFCWSGCSFWWQHNLSVFRRLKIDGFLRGICQWDRLFVQFAFLFVCF